MTPEIPVRSLVVFFRNRDPTTGLVKNKWKGKEEKGSGKMVNE